MEIRKPAQAGRFYPGRKDELQKLLKEYTSYDKNKITAKGILCPHAGYMYSGKTAGMVYGRINIPDTVVVIGPNHTGLGEDISVYPAGGWETPIGNLEINEEFINELTDSLNIIIKDKKAHEHEHSIEVQLPFIKYLNKNAKIVPICVMQYSASICKDIGEAIAITANNLGREILVVASSDMTHYETQSIAEKNDRLVLDKILKLDPREMLEVVNEQGISMCGAGPCAIMMYAAKKLGAKKAKLINYTTSGEVTGDKSAVVGYAGVAVY
ncbi:MAG: AmmeMemoRadiSam system protein B [Elusimicrobiota bacterium]